MSDGISAIAGLMTLIGIVAGAATAFGVMRYMVSTTARDLAAQRKLHAADRAEQQRDVEALRREIADFKLDVAHRYATYEAIEKMEERLTVAIGRLGDRFDDLIMSMSKGRSRSGGL